MIRLRTTIGRTASAASLDAVVAAMRREAEGSDADPFDDAMMAAVAGLAEGLKAEAVALKDIEVRLRKVAQRSTA